MFWHVSVCLSTGGVTPARSSWGGGYPSQGVPHPCWGYLRWGTPQLDQTRVPPGQVWQGYLRWGTPASRDGIPPQPDQTREGYWGGVPPGQVQRGYSRWGKPPSRDGLLPPWPGLIGGTQGGIPPAGMGYPPPYRTTDGILDMPRSVCLLCPCRRTFLLPTAYVVWGKVMFWHVSVHRSSICLSTPREGGTPARSRRGYPCQVQLGGTPTGVPQPGGGGYPNWGRGYPNRGYPTSGIPPSDVAGEVPQWGTPPRVPPLTWPGSTLTRGYPTSGTPIRPGQGSTPMGVPHLEYPHQTWPGGYPNGG